MKKILIITALCGALFYVINSATSARGLIIDSLHARAVREFRKKIPVNPITITGDPYSRPLPKPAPAGTVCAVKYMQDRTHYRLESFPNERAALRKGYTVTHRGRCGTCSTLQDLAVYLAYPDLTTPVRRCGLRSIIKPWGMACLRELEFSEACAETWYYNQRNTSQHCAAVCVQSWIKGEPFNRKDGTLNACLACDEKISGPAFKASAGRTRRNSGIRSAIGRRKKEVYHLRHDYF